MRRGIRACVELSKNKEGIPIWPLPNNFDEFMLKHNQKKVWQKAAGTIN